MKIVDTQKICRNIHIYRRLKEGAYRANCHCYTKVFECSIWLDGASKVAVLYSIECLNDIEHNLYSNFYSIKLSEEWSIKNRHSSFVFQLAQTRKNLLNFC